MLARSLSWWVRRAKAWSLASVSAWYLRPRGSSSSCMSTRFSGSSAMNSRPPRSRKRLSAADSSGRNGFCGPITMTTVASLGTSAEPLGRAEVAHVVVLVDQHVAQGLDAGALVGVVGRLLPVRSPWPW